MGIISKLISGKQGRLYLRFLVLAVVLGGAIYAYSAIASVRGDAL